MGVEISYMGSKRRIAAVVADIVRRLPEGSLLDAFSGMCAVGEAIAPSRQIWTNEIQPFPCLVARALFCSRRRPIPSDELRCILEPPFRRNLKALSERFNGYLRKERKYLETGKLGDVLAGNTDLPYVGSDVKLDRERKRLARMPNTFPYRLATLTYVGSYFGATQCMELDSLRYAMDTAVANGNIDEEQREWLIVALGQVLCRINNSTGQFAQYIKPRNENIGIILQKRRRSVWEELFPTADSISPLGTREWRSKNRCFCSDTLVLLEKMRRCKHRPGIVYADPPYSSAQYSRYYHVLDMVVEYRYPQVTGIGRYPDRRFQTPFAQSAAVLNSMTRLVQRISTLRASLVLSYPENGLYFQKAGNMMDLLREHYRRVEVAYSRKHQHSTFGGSRAAPKVCAVENVYVAYP